MRKNLLILILFFTSNFLLAQCWTTVSPGGAHTMGIRNGGVLFTWGRNNNGQIGNGTNGVTIYNTPQQIGADTNWSKISAGNSHCLATKTDGTLWAWGRNGDGQIGVGSTNALFNTPQQIGTENSWNKISAGDEFCLAIKNNGTLWAWGDNTYGQIGDNSVVDKTSPVQIGTDNNWVEISAGTDHSIALKSDGTIWVWGRNNLGQFGMAAPLTSSVPIQMGTDTNWSKIYAGREHSIGIKTNNTYWVWGGNTNGQFGNGGTVPSNTPTPITSFDSATFISKGHQHSCVIKTDGTIWSTGGNTSGQLGNGNNTQQVNPVQENSLSTNWILLESKVSHTTALKSDGSLYTWGANLYGQLGDGSTAAKNTPTSISCPTLSIDEFAHTEVLEIYPNPVESVLNFRNSDYLIDTILITDLTGKKIIELKSINTNELDVSNLKSGVYFIHLKSEEKLYQAKFVKL